jgi:hypothetical protein
LLTTVKYNGAGLGLLCVYMQNPFRKRNVTVRCEKCGCFYDSVLGHNPKVCEIVKKVMRPVAQEFFEKLGAKPWPLPPGYIDEAGA